MEGLWSEEEEEAEAEERLVRAEADHSPRRAKVSTVQTIQFLLHFVFPCVGIVCVSIYLIISFYAYMHPSATGIS